MARPKAFDEDAALAAAIGVFREHGYEGTSARMLVDAMGIGRQSLYDTFGDKWRLYLAALKRYSIGEQQAHRAALRSCDRAIDGLRAMVARVVRDARTACLGVGSIAEFGCSRPEIAAINAEADRHLRAALVDRVRAAQAEGDIAAALDADMLATYFVASFAGIRIAARGGATDAHLKQLGEMTLRALR